MGGQRDGVRSGGRGASRRTESSKSGRNVGQFACGLTCTGGGLEVVRGVVAEVLERPVLHVEQPQWGAVSREELAHVVLRDVQRVTLLDVEPLRLQGDSRVVLLGDLRLD